MKTKIPQGYWIAMPILSLMLIMCGLPQGKSRSERLNNTIKTTAQNKSSNTTENTQELSASPEPETRKIGKAIFYLENSGSMFGYVKGFSEYVDVVSELAEKPRFVEHRIRREFHFVNGGQNIRITEIGENPATLKDKLNTKGFNCGDISRSNLNAMFQLALSKAKDDTITILISDAIYDLGKPQAPLSALSTEGRETRSRFIERLHDGNVQTIIIKLNSHFEGDYYPVTGGRVKMNQERPFYVFIFGDTELLNEYFPENYIKSLKGFVDVARFLKFNQSNIKYKATTHDKMGDFRYDRSDKNTLINVKTDRHGQGFQLTIASDFSTLPFSDSYLNSTSNYSSSNPNYSIKKVCGIGNVNLYGLNFTPTHLITVYTDKNPLGQLNISLLNNVPNWIKDTNIDDEKNILGDTTHTFGFKFLTEAISEAYQYKNPGTDIVNFKLELK